jgi:hypothetical protein
MLLQAFSLQVPASLAHKKIWSSVRIPVFGAAPANTAVRPNCKNKVDF